VITTFRTIVLATILLLVTAVIVSGQGLPTASPEDVGLSGERLARIKPVMEQYVTQKKIVGGVTLVARRGKVAYLETFGMQDSEAGKPMRTDTIVRIASMTKPVTATAAMILYEEGKFLLSDPVSKYIPEFKDPHVVVPNPDSSSSFIIVPAKREITIRMLLNHTSGLTYGGGKLGDYYSKAGVTGWQPRDRGTIGDMVKKLAPLPLNHQPGEEWAYGLSQDVLGYLIEIVSGMPLDQFFRERIFEPLRMNDTFFFPPEAKLSRLSPNYTMTADGVIERQKDAPGEIITQDRGIYFSGGGGLYSTATDYVRFAQMLLNGGELDGVRILSRKTVELMTTDSTGGIVILEGTGDTQATHGDRYGLGLGIRGEPGDIESTGTFGWGGAFHTLFWVDPKEELIGIFMTQLGSMADKSQHRKFRVMAYAAIID